MAKKVIMYPLVRETKYYEQNEWNDKQGWTGQPKNDEVKGTLYNYYNGYGWEEENTEWVENRVFENTLTYIDFGRGRSAVTFYFTGKDGERYPMFIKDFDELIRKHSLVNGSVTARWTFVKRGSNYGIKLAEEENL